MMPLYEFECRNCKKEFDALAKYDETGAYKDVECPHCGSKRHEKLMSICNHTFTNPVGTDKWNSETTGHDYRFKHNLPKVLAEREAAERAKLGLPYKEIDDANKYGEGIHDPETRGGLS